MSPEEIAVVLLCLFGGYWAVSFLFNGRSKTSRRGSKPEATLSSEVPSESIPSWATILGVAADASAEEIRRAYQQRIAEYHPDKVAALGAELRELAERKSKEINLAYEDARRSRSDAT